MRVQLQESTLNSEWDKLSAAFEIRQSPIKELFNQGYIEVIVTQKDGRKYKYTLAACPTCGRSG
jgi:hypothetical protein